MMTQIFIMIRTVTRNLEVGKRVVCQSLGLRLSLYAKIYTIVTYCSRRTESGNKSMLHLGSSKCRYQTQINSQWDNSYCLQTRPLAL